MFILIYSINWEQYIPCPALLSLLILTPHFLFQSMKKNILTSAALMAFAAATYAQVINQDGTQQYAQQNQFGINQTGAIRQIQAPNDPARTNYGNYAITFQTATQPHAFNNTLVINQNDGSQGNRAGIGQVNSSDTGGSLAVINQNGGPDGLSGGATSVSATIGAAGENGNFAGISQNGSGHNATINQNNNSRRNAAEIYQNGSLGMASISQSNNSVGNTAFVYQGFSGPGVVSGYVIDARAEINQGKSASGDVSSGSAAPEAVGSTAVVTQTTSSVRASIIQGGYIIGGGAGRAEAVDARVNQSARGNNPLYYGGTAGANIRQGIAGAEAIGSKANINQTGVSHLANIRQGEGTFSSDRQSSATITQIGSSDYAADNAAIFQGTNGGKSESDQATITQTETSSGAFGQIIQGQAVNATSTAYSRRDKATISQNNSSAAYVYQNSSASAGGGADGGDNSASITQGAGVAVIQQGYALGNYALNTNRNTASITQGAGASMKAKIQQGGNGPDFQDANGATFRLSSLTGTLIALTGSTANDNSASITQGPSKNFNANIYQNGLFNSATVNQSNGDGHQALIIQTSNSERAMAAINQSSSGSGNFATILQFTGANADGVGQYGNMATINQIAGSNNTVFIQQGVQGSSTISNDNLINVTQNGSNNFARFLQVGNNNVLNLTQNGSNNQVLNLAGDPNSYASQQGNNNQLTLTQNGSNLTFRYTQIGNNNVQVVEQTP